VWLELDQTVEEEQLANPESIHDNVLLEYWSQQYYWATKTLQDLVSLTHASCQWLEECGYNAKTLKINGNIRPRTLANTRIPKDAPLEVHIKVMVSSGISSSSLFYTIGPTCLSVDEIFVRFEYRERGKLFAVEKKEYERVLKRRTLKTRQKLFLPRTKKLTQRPSCWWF
jgi:hypothetical protein